MRKAFNQLLVDTCFLSRFLHRFLTNMQKTKEPEALIQLVDKYEPCLLKLKKLPDFYSSTKHCFGDLRKSPMETKDTYSRLLKLYTQVCTLESLFDFEDREEIYENMRTKNIPL